jgi:vitamin B12 transporter
LQWELRAYHTNVENLINWSIGTSPINIDKAEIQGLEAEIALQMLGFQQKVNMNILDPRDQATHNVLPNRAQQTISYDISRSFGGFDFGAKALAQTGRFNDADNKVRLGGYATFDLRTAYHLDKNWMLAAKFNNILDKQYQTVDNYTTFGRNFFLTIHYTY